MRPAVAAGDVRRDGVTRNGAEALPQDQEGRATASAVLPAAWLTQLGMKSYALALLLPAHSLTANEVAANDCGRLFPAFTEAIVFAHPLATQLDVPFDQEACMDD